MNLHNQVLARHICRVQDDDSLAGFKSNALADNAAIEGITAYINTTCIEDETLPVCPLDVRSVLGYSTSIDTKEGGGGQKQSTHIFNHKIRNLLQPQYQPNT